MTVLTNLIARQEKLQEDTRKLREEDIARQDKIQEESIARQEKIQEENIARQKKMQENIARQEKLHRSLMSKIEFVEVCGKGAS